MQVGDGTTERCEAAKPCSRAVAVLKRGPTCTRCRQENAMTPQKVLAELSPAVKDMRPLETCKKNLEKHLKNLEKSDDDG